MGSRFSKLEAGPFNPQFVSEANCFRLSRESNRVSGMRIARYRLINAHVAPLKQ